VAVTGGSAVTSKETPPTPACCLLGAMGITDWSPSRTRGVVVVVVVDVLDPMAAGPRFRDGGGGSFPVGGLKEGILRRVDSAASC
jgi:hypothetical protein